LNIGFVDGVVVVVMMVVELCLKELDFVLLWYLQHKNVSGCLVNELGLHG